MARLAAAALPLALAVALAVVAMGCGTSSPSVPTAVDCPADIRAPGTFPDLEALVPRSLDDRPPPTVDSGANCTSVTLGSYVTHGIGELRFAGATWDEGNGNGTVAAVLQTRPVGQPALEVAWVEEFYTAGAVAGRHIGEVATTRPTMAGAGQVFRLEVINDLSLQTVIVWPAGPFVRVVIVATPVEPGASRADHDRRVVAAVEAAAAVPISQAGRAGRPARSSDPGSRTGRWPVLLSAR